MSIKIKTFKNKKDKEIEKFINDIGYRYIKDILYAIDGTLDTLDEFVKIIYVDK